MDGGPMVSMNPSTPAHAPYIYTHKPTNSSPLAPSSSSPGSSPIAAAQARRRSQYKARAPSGSVASSSRSNAAPQRPVGFGAGPQLGEVGDDAQTAFLRTRLKLRCLERASKARHRAVQKKRVMGSSDAESDDIEMDVGEDGEEDFAFDELFTRIMHNTTRKTHHAYMHSYDREVGSFDPALEEPQNWETELAIQDASDETIENLGDDPELQAYLEEQAAFADFADIPTEDLFSSWSDIDDDLLANTKDEDMDLS
ncbi:hypothetical protein C8F04DRAFT_1099506 [Mycena alexandri]|uniref:Uncharacterized protein n=1 Tax=Mycena alexandri TaxID=1745969 RepID=A0AAD6SZ30_9AGAR|nr:hypothetical protein C8F04DRAFT_1099506 [Mycena alexandri]